MGYGREDIRIIQSIPAISQAVYDENGVIMPQIVDVPMTIIDLSATGLLIKSEREFKPKYSLYIVFDIANVHLEIISKIKRREKVSKNEWNYGCKFIHLTEYEEEIIRRYIFDCELNKRR